MALIICPECGHSISDKAIACPSCGYPVQAKPIRQAKRRRKLPNGFGTIKKLSGNRQNPYAAYPPTTEYQLTGSPVAQPAIGYYHTWHEAYDALADYKKSPYDVSMINATFKEIYDAWFDEKYVKNQKRKFSKSSVETTKSAFKNCASLHDKTFRDLRKADLQKAVDDCPLKHASLELIINLYHQMYAFAMENDIVDKDYSATVKINIPDDDEKGTAFTPEEIEILKNNSDNPTVQTILMMICTGYRISAYSSLKVNLEEKYFQGGVKTTAGKDRIVPWTADIIDYARNFKPEEFKPKEFRIREFYPTLEELGIAYAPTGEKHTPHDCRHTFSWLCDKYKVDPLSKHILMGHSLGKDVEANVYGHRTLTELRTEINKIRL
ncbi:MAG: zinc-ribbon domain-containing protein [Lachnospiraceae bacterium]|nr:zinc-ribbon domain-containing protein [Lachnospiraceae bacterium]